MWGKAQLMASLKKKWRKCHLGIESLAKMAENGAESGGLAKMRKRRKWRRISIEIGGENEENSISAIGIGGEES
jgi:hypothetical protein